MAPPTRPRRFASLALLLGLAGGCASAAPAELGVVAPPSLAVPDDAERYELGPTEASIEADVRAAASYTLRFPRQRGTLVFSAKRPEASSVDVTIDTTSAEAALDVVADIARAEFLHTSQFPTARFTSSALRKNAEGGYDLYGDLELCGRTKPVVVRADLAFDACKIQVDSEFAIDRRVFGAISDGSLDGVVSDTVVVRIGARVRRKGAPASCPRFEDD